MRQLRLRKLRASSKVLISLSVVIFVYTVATTIMQYKLALFVDELTPSYTFFGLIMGLPWLFSLLTDMPTGAFAERFGKKRTVTLGLFGLALSGFILSAVSNVFNLFWVLVLFGIFEGFLTVAGMASIIAAAARLKENRFVVGYLSASSFGYAVGPLLAGAVVAWFGGQTPFLIFACICFGAGVFSIFAIPADSKKTEVFFTALRNVVIKDRIYKAELKEFFSVGRIAVFIGAFMLVSGMWSEFIWAMEPILIKEAGESALWGGVILSAFVVPFALLDYPVGRWIDRKQKRFLSIFFGLFACGAGVIAFSFAHSPVLMLSAAAGTSVGFAFFYVAANGIFDSFSTYHARGLMTGVWQSAEDIGFVIGPILGGLLADIWGLRAAFMFFGFIFLVLMLAVLKEKQLIVGYELR